MLRTLLIVAGAVAIATALPAAAQRSGERTTGKPDLAVAAATEPPDFVAPGGSFLASFTVGNQGTAPSPRTVRTGAFLAASRVPTADDRRRRVGEVMIRPLQPGHESTRRRVIAIPPTFAPGVYHLLLCADVRNEVDESNDRANCHLSGQTVRIAAQR